MFFYISFQVTPLFQKLEAEQIENLRKRFSGGQVRNGGRTDSSRLLWKPLTVRGDISTPLLRLLKIVGVLTLYLTILYEPGDQ